MVLFIGLTYLLLHGFCFTSGSHPTAEAPKNLIKNILRNNGESLKQLASKFPDHIIEMQVEMVDPTPEPPKHSLSSIRRLLKFNKKPSTHLNQNKLGMLLRKQPMRLSRAIVRSDDKNETGATIPSTITATSELDKDSENRPVYMKDLKEAVAALEKKLDSKNTAEDTSKSKVQNINEASNNAENDDGNHPLLKKDLWEILDIAAQHHNTPPNRIKKLSGIMQAPQQDEATMETANYNNSPGVKNIGDVISLVKKGVKVQFDIEQPTDPNLDWIQIKVPNNN